MSIQLANICKKYGDQMVLDQVSFEVGRGKVAGFIGPNGAGKSTTMKIIMGLISPLSGEVKVNGKNVGEHSLEIRRRIGYLPESNPLYVEMYVREYLAYIAGMYGYRKKIRSLVDGIIERTGLGVEAHKQIRKLSRGYRQRVGLAQALIHDPEILILDEPTTGLDPNQIVEIRTMIAELGREKTIMLSTHIMQEVEAICDRVIIINHGKIVADESMDDTTGRELEEKFRALTANPSPDPGPAPPPKAGS